MNQDKICISKLSHFIVSKNVWNDKVSVECNFVCPSCKTEMKMVVENISSNETLNLSSFFDGETCVCKHCCNNFIVDDGIVYLE